MGTFHRRNGFYTVQTVFYVPYTNTTPKPAYHIYNFVHFYIFN